MLLIASKVVFLIESVKTRSIVAIAEAYFKEPTYLEHDVEYVVAVIGVPSDGELKQVYFIVCFTGIIYYRIDSRSIGF